jgi:hypothetical protein
MADELARKAAEKICIAWYNEDSEELLTVEAVERIISEAYAPLREELGTLQAGCQELVGAVAKGRTHYSRDHGEPNPSRAFPYEHVFSIPQWKEVEAAAEKVQKIMEGKDAPKS